MNMSDGGPSACVSLYSMIEWKEGVLEKWWECSGVGNSPRDG